MREREKEIKRIHKEEKFFLVCFLSLLLLGVLFVVVVLYEQEVNELEARLTVQETWNVISWNQVQEKNELIARYQEQTLHCTQGELNPLVT